MGCGTLIANVAASLHARPEYSGTVVMYGRKAVTSQRQGTGRANRVVFCPSRTPGEFAPAQSPGQPHVGGIPELVALVENLRVKVLAHFAFVTDLVHLNADATSGLGIGGAVTTFSSALARVNQLRTAYQAHRLLVVSGLSQVHLAADTTNYLVEPVAFDVNSAARLANDLRAKFAAHEADTTSHTVADATNLVTSSTARTAGGRPLKTWRETIEVHCWGRDDSEPNSELAQDDAARLLAMATIAAIHESDHAGVGAYEVKAPRFTVDPVELRFGSEVIFDLLMPIRVEALRQPTVIAASADVEQVMEILEEEIESETYTVPPP